MPSPNDWYGGWAKRMAELHVEAARVEFGWDALAVARPANVYGPFDNFEGRNAMVIPSLIRKALSGNKVMEVWGDGRARRDFIHARDAAKGILTVAKKMPGRPVNIGSGQGVSIRELVEIILSNLEHRPEVAWDVSKPTGDEERIMDVSRARDLGFEPEISIQDGITQVMDWYRENQGLKEKRYDLFASV